MLIPDLNTDCEACVLAVKSAPRFTRRKGGTWLATLDLVASIPTGDDAEAFQLQGRLAPHRAAMLQAMSGGEYTEIVYKPGKDGTLTLRPVEGGDAVGPSTSCKAVVQRVKVVCDEADPRVEYQLRIVIEQHSLALCGELVSLMGCDVESSFAAQQIELAA